MHILRRSWLRAPSTARSEAMTVGVDTPNAAQRYRRNVIFSSTSDSHLVSYTCSKNPQYTSQKGCREYAAARVRQCFGRQACVLSIRVSRISEAIWPLV